MPGKADIISALKQQIMPLQGYKPVKSREKDPALGVLHHAFPQGCFPTGAIHECICHNTEEMAATDGFISGILSSLMKRGSAAIWISRDKNIFPPALVGFGIRPEHIVFVQMKREQDILWATEEALKCPELTAVVSEVKELSFTTSRRFQLSVEQTGTTGFIILHRPKNILQTASLARWHIHPMPSDAYDLPGIGVPRWKVELLKVRNARPASWTLEWQQGVFRRVDEQQVPLDISTRKTG